MSNRLGTIVGVLAWCAALAAIASADQPPPAKPPWQRLLQGEDARKSQTLERQLQELQEAAKFEAALAVAEELAALRTRLQGADHWQAVNAKYAAEAVRKVSRTGKEDRAEYAHSFSDQREGTALVGRGRYREAQPLFEKVLAIRRELLGEQHPDTAASYNNVAFNLNAQGRYKEAEEGYQKALANCRKVLGEEHPDTATSYNNVASNLDARGRHKEAEEGFRKALAIRRKVLGEEHPDTATSYNNVASNLNAQGRYKEAQEGYQKALAICRKVRGEDHRDTAFSYIVLAASLDAQGRYKEAQEGFKKALAIRRKVLGEEHPDTATSYNHVALNLANQGRYKEAEEGFRKALAIHRKVLGEQHPDTAGSYNNVAFNLNAQGRYKEAEEGYQKALAIYRKVLGEEHPLTAGSYNNVAFNLDARGRHKEAEEGFRKALAIRRKVLGEEHPDTATSYNNVASNLNAQGRYKEAEEGYQKALAIYRKVLGEEHPLTAVSYNNVAYTLKAQGRYKEAEEGFKKALAIRRKLLGEEHPLTAGSYNNLAGNLDAQGRYKEAEEGFKKALAIRRKLLGEEHPDTAISYNNVAGNLKAQGRYKEAEEGHQKALAIRRKLLGEEHPLTAISYNNVAFNLEAQGRYKEAEEGYQKALAICRKVLGEEHPDTARSYNNVAGNLKAQGRYKEAEEGYQKALAICRKVLGEEHPHTAVSYNNLAANLTAQGRYKEAEELYRHGADAFLASRLHIAASGLGRSAKTSELSPLLPLVALLARNGKPAVAWQRLEQGLGRGTGDDLAARLRRPVKELARQTELVKQLERLDQLLAQHLAIRAPTPAQKEEQDALLDRRLKAQEELTRFGRYLEEKYGPADGKVFDRKTIQAALPDDTALVAWIDIPAAGPKAADPNDEHWAVLLRSQGEPVFERLRGSSPGGEWSAEDTDLPSRLRMALVKHRGGWQRLARQLGEQRLGPLRKHLAVADKVPAVKHLVVLPSVALAGMPVELLIEDCTVSYALSGTLYAHLRKLPAVKGTGLLAVGDPVFETATAAAAKPHPLPPGGVLLTLVQPGSNAAQSRLRPDDVLLKYGDVELKTPADLKAAVAATDARADIPVQVWREGKTIERLVRPGPLGVVVASEPAPRALAERYRLDRVLSTRRGDDSWEQLPGTRVEVEALQRLFGGKAEARLLFDSEASEEHLDELASSGALGRYRYLHLATHGEVDDGFALRSAVILARDTLPDPQQQLLVGKPVYDGRLTAEEILRSWNLNSELVTLSACQTALGKYERGEGFVGFAQALLLCGSRSVCLSLWKVDDGATAMLMQRFYANLLGKREGLKAPMPKAAALREAKEWLRSLSREEALRVAAEVSQGVERGKGRPKGKLLPPLPEAGPAEKEDRPYGHPYYWAAFVLVGNPD
jgi:tetratricopeptide (TPR) repeat protein